MARVVQVVVTRTYTYAPALTDLEYTMNGVTTIEGAMDFDKHDYATGEISLEEISTADPVEVTTWSIVDE